MAWASEPDWWIAILTGLLTAATCALGVVTYLLWRSTAAALKDSARSSEAAMLTARAVLGAELPVLRMQSPDMLTTSTRPADDDAYGGVVASQAAGRFNVVGRLSVHNYGRTPAFPTSVRYGSFFGANLPGEPAYSETTLVEPNAIIRPESDRDFWLRPLLIAELSDEQMAEAKHGQAWLWYFVSIEYSDFLGIEHEARFCWRWRRARGTKYLFSFESHSGGEPAYTSST